MGGSFGADTARRSPPDLHGRKQNPIVAQTFGSRERKADAGDVHRLKDRGEIAVALHVFDASPSAVPGGVKWHKSSAPAGRGCFPSWASRRVREIPSPPRLQTLPSE